MASEELDRRARAVGVATSFEDAQGRRHRVPDSTIELVLAAMGAEPGSSRRAGTGEAPDPWPAVVVLRSRPTGGSAGGAPVARHGRRWAPPPTERARLVLESGEERSLPASLPGDLPLGYHRVEGERGSTRLVVAPPSCHLPAWLAQGGRAWGFSAQLYALASRASWGIGDLGDLALLAGPEVAGTLGAAFVLLNPLHAANSAEQPSPYFPSSRLFRNPLYLRVEAVPELAGLDPDGRARVAEMAAAGRRLSAGARIDREAVHRLKDEALRRCHQVLGADPERAAALAAYRAASEGLDGFATFSGLQRELGNDWRAWPAAYRDPSGAAVRRWAAAHATEVRYHAWLQWLLSEQLAAVPRLAVGVLGDLAVGVDPGGFDAWTFQRELARGVTVGAPPDPLGPHGQDWGLPPFVPARLAAAGHQPFARTVRAGLAHVQGLRIDHVMGLFRLFWIPEGRPASEGTYVRYPADDLLGVLALESVRAGALVIGEDLGTVAPGVRERLAAEQVLSYRLVWFERAADRARSTGPLAVGSASARERPVLRGATAGCPADRATAAVRAARSGGGGPISPHEAPGPRGRRRAADYPRLALAAATTHDLPSVAGFFSGADLARLNEIGVVADADLAATSARQEAERRELRGLLAAEGLLPPGDDHDIAELIAALYAFLARTPSMLVAATLEDAVATTERPNVPGTVDEHPNWSLRLPVRVEDLATDPRVRRLAGVLAAERPTPADRPKR